MRCRRDRREDGAHLPPLESGEQRTGAACQEEPAAEHTPESQAEETATQPICDRVAGKGWAPSADVTSTVDIRAAEGCLGP